jgi:hypothetical protein
LLVKSERSIDIGNVQGNTGERKVHSFYLSRSCYLNAHGFGVVAVSSGGIEKVHAHLGLSPRNLANA